MSDALSDGELDEIEAQANAPQSAPWESFVEERDHLAGQDFIRTGRGDRSAPDVYVTLSYWDNSCRSRPGLTFSTSSR